MKKSIIIASFALAIFISFPSTSEAQFFYSAISSGGLRMTNNDANGRFYVKSKFGFLMADAAGVRYEPGFVFGPSFHWNSVEYKLLNSEKLGNKETFFGMGFFIQFEDLFEIINHSMALGYEVGKSKGTYQSFSIGVAPHWLREEFKVILNVDFYDKVKQPVFGLGASIYFD